MWEAINAIVAILAFLFMIFIEWPRFKTRLAEAHVREKLLSHAINVAVILPNAMSVIAFGSMVLALLFSSAQILMFLSFRAGVRNVEPQMIADLTVLAIAFWLINIGLSGLMSRSKGLRHWASAASFSFGMTGVIQVILHWINRWI